MITREQAIQAAIDYLTRGLRRRLQAAEGWPEGMLVPPRFVGGSLSRESEEGAERVWQVLVPSDEPHVGSSRYLVIDQETGKVIADGWAGE